MGDLPWIALAVLASLGVAFLAHLVYDAAQRAEDHGGLPERPERPQRYTWW